VATLRSTCHTLSNVYIRFPVLVHFREKKNSCHDLWINPRIFICKYRAELGDVMYFTSLLWATGWSGESECCAFTYALVCSLLVMENWIVNHSIFTVRTNFKTKCIVQMQRHFQHESNVLKHNRTTSHNAILR
jgi:hypothetical protein